MFKNIEIYLLNKLLPYLIWLDRQIKQNGVRSEYRNTLYCDETKQFILDFDLENRLFSFTDDIEQAKDFGKYWDNFSYKKLVEIQTKNKFRFRKILAMFGGNFGGSEPLNFDGVTANTLGSVDNVSMDKMG